MKSLEDEVKELRGRNTLLAQRVQHYRILSNKKDTEKIELLKEINSLRMKLNKHRNAGSAMDKYLQASVQELSEKSLTGLVEVSTGIAKCIEVMKSYMAKRQDIEKVEVSPTPRKSNSNVRRVVPMIGGRTILPGLVLSRLSDMYLTGAPENQPNNGSTGEVQDERREDVAVENGIEARSQAALVDRNNMQNLFVTLHRLNMEQLNQAASGSDSDGEFSPVSSEEDDAMVEEDVEAEGVEEEEEEEPQDLRRSDNLAPVEEEMEGEEEETPTLRNVAVVIQRLSPHVLPGHTPHRVSAREPHSVGDPMEGPSWLLDARPAGTEDINSNDNSSPTFFSAKNQRSRINRKKIKEPLQAPDSTTEMEGAVVDEEEGTVIGEGTVVGEGLVVGERTVVGEGEVADIGDEDEVADDVVAKGEVADVAVTEGVGIGDGADCANGEGGRWSHSRHSRKRNASCVTILQDSDCDEEESWRPSKRTFVRQRKRSARAEKKDPTSVRVLLSKMNMEAHLQSLTSAPASPVFRSAPRVPPCQEVTPPTHNLFAETETPSPNGSVPHIYISDNSITPDRSTSDEECDRRRPRRVILKNYKEKPLNRKLRRG